MFVRLVLLLVLLSESGGYPVVCARPSSDDLTIRLSRHVHNYSISSLNFVAALVRVSNDFQVPMGIAWTNTPDALALRSLAWKDATVEQIISAVAETQLGYKVGKTASVVHIFHGEAIPEQENFLTLQVKDFHVENDFTELASFRLQNLISPRRYSGFSMAANTDPRINLDLRDSTVQGALDALVLASPKRKIWVVTFSSDSKAVTPEGFRRTMSLWSDKLAPDLDQPVWDLLRWGDPDPPLLAKSQS